MKQQLGQLFRLPENRHSRVLPVGVRHVIPIENVPGGAQFLHRVLGELVVGEKALGVIVAAHGRSVH